LERGELTMGERNSSKKDKKPLVSKLKTSANPRVSQKWGQKNWGEKRVAPYPVPKSKETRWGGQTS